MRCDSMSYVYQIKIKCIWRKLFSMSVFYVFQGLCILMCVYWGVWGLNSQIWKYLYSGYGSMEQWKNMKMENQTLDIGTNGVLEADDKILWVILISQF